MGKVIVQEWMTLDGGAQAPDARRQPGDDHGRDPRNVGAGRRLILMTISNLGQPTDRRSQRAGLG
jgi:hypothetical protein